MTTADGKKYIILSAILYEDLMDMVNEALEAGYICMGGVATTAGPNGQRVIQAMVKDTAYGV
jgi:hypothetical protein